MSDTFNDKLKRSGWIPAATVRTPKPYTPATSTSNATSYAQSALERESIAMAQTPEGGRNHQLNVSAFNLGQLVGAGALTEDTVIDQLSAAARSTPGEPMTEREIANTIRSGLQAGMRDPRTIPEQTTGTNVTVVDFRPPTPAKCFDVRPYEGGFWESRASLAVIYSAALNGMCSPWAVLACCAARALALVPPHTLLPPIIGAAGGSLNWFGVLTAVSGGGKSTAMEVAQSLVSGYIMTRTPGSGEGLIEAFGSRDEEGRPKGENAHAAIMFTVDELDTLTAVGGRSGATIMPVLRTAFTGGTQDFTYRSKLPTLASHTYRLTLVCAAQPGRTRALFADRDGGTPQRFMWFPATDDRVSKRRPPRQGSLSLPPVTAWQYPQTLHVPADCEATILEAREAQARGLSAAMDSHALFAREKFAYALAVLDGRTQMSTEDWQLSAIAANVSAAIREWTMELLDAAELEEASHKGRIAGMTRESADAEVVHQKRHRISRVGRLLLDKMPATEPVLKQSLASRDRSMFDAAIIALTHAGAAIKDEDSGKWSVKL